MTCPSNSRAGSGAPACEEAVSPGPILTRLGIDMPYMVFTNHAVERFIERHVPGTTPEVARRALGRACRRATLLRPKTPAGGMVWSVTEPSLKLVAQRDPHGVLVCVTVLPPEVPWLCICDREAIRAPNGLVWEHMGRMGRCPASGTPWIDLPEHRVKVAAGWR